MVARRTYLLPTARAILDGILRLHLNLAADTFGGRGRVDRMDMVTRQATALALEILILELGVGGQLVAQVGGAVLVPGGSAQCCRVLRPSHIKLKERVNRA